MPWSQESYHCHLSYDPDRYLAHTHRYLKPYTSEGFLESRPVNEAKVLTTSQALNLLKQRGYIIKDDVVPAP